MTHHEAKNGPVPPLILHVIHHLTMGGLENGLINLINGMEVGAFRHAIACVESYSDFGQRLKRPDVEVIALHRSKVGVWSVRRALFRLMRRLRPTIVHSRAMSGLDALLPAALAGVRHRVHGEHGWDMDDLEGRAWKPRLLRRLHSPLVDRYVTVSQHIRRYLIEQIGIEASRIEQIYNGVDTARFAPVQRRRSGLLPYEFAGADSVVIGTVGRLQSVKDQQTLVRAFALAAADETIGARIRLVIVGDGPLESDLRTLVDELGLKSRTWMPGAVDDVPQVMQALDVFALPSLAEGVSNTLLEAMASGLPVIATNVGGNAELVQDGTTGRLFVPGDVATLSSLLAQYTVETDYRRSHALAARQRAVERYSLEVMIRRYQAVYDRLCGGR
jgi:sugar transferase (PEP-CTERM/EpsH1 system associated)